MKHHAPPLNFKHAENGMALTRSGKSLDTCQGPFQLPRCFKLSYLPQKHREGLLPISIGPLPMNALIGISFLTMVFLCIFGGNSKSLPIHHPFL